MRIEKAVQSQLREEQAGFRKGRSCTEQIFVLQNIIEQCIEWQSTIYLNFIDFQKAFDSIHRETMWKILRLYGIPEIIIRIIQALYNDFTCSVLHNGNLTPWFAVQSGVKQGCMLSPLLFLTVLDWIMKETIKDNRTGIRWTLTTQLEDLDFADDICLTSSTRTHLRSKTLKLCSTAKKVGMKIGIKKTKLMTIGESPNPTIKIDGQEIETVDKFTYLGSIVDVNGGTDADVKSRINKARHAFAILKPIWKSRKITLRTKIRLFNTNVKSVLLYGSECWKITSEITRKIQVFIHKCLRIILKIKWSDKVSNAEIRRRCFQENIMVEITRRKWRFIGHILRKDSTSISRTGLFWTPDGKRKRGRPRATWRRTSEKELEDLGWSWAVIRKKAQDQQCWRTVAETLCARWYDKDRWWWWWWSSVCVFCDCSLS